MGIFGGDSKFESSVKLVPYPQQAVYNNISDLSNLEKVRDRIQRTRSVTSVLIRIPSAFRCLPLAS